MTLTVTTDFILIRKTIYDWLLTYASVNSVIYTNQEVNRPTKPYASILINNGSLRFGHDEERNSYNGTSGVLERTTSGTRQMVVQCEVYSDPATTPNDLEAAELLESALLALDSEAVKSVFRAAKIGILSHTPVIRLDDQTGDRWERRALSDVIFTYSGETFDDGLTGETGNIVETVEIPTEDNANATYNE